MGKRRVKNTYENYCKKLTEGRGTKDGIDYLPWLTGHEFASKGAYIRMMGFTIPRMYILLSHLEADVFRIYDHMTGVDDIKDQFPLPLVETLSLAAELGIRHPYSDSFYNVVTTDLLILKDGKWMGRAIKTSKDLGNKRVIEKLRLEQAWYKKMGLDWKIVTEKEVNRELVANIRWLYEDGEDIQALIPSQALLLQCERTFLELYQEGEMAFPDIIEVVEEAFSLPSGYGMALFKRLVRTKQVEFNMEGHFNPGNPKAPYEKRGTRYGRYSSYA